MAKRLSIIGQEAMDNYYTNYKSDTNFFTIDDFIRYAGNTAASIYRQYYEKQYGDTRQEKKEEVVAFDTGMLSEQVLEVENKNGNLFAKLKEPIMSFLYDQQSVGIQNVFIETPVNGGQIERTTLSQLYALRYFPVSNRVFFYGGIDTINFVNKGVCNVKTVRVFYIPSMYPNALIADGIAEDIIKETVATIKGLSEGMVVKKSLDGNQNVVVQSEIDKKSLVK